MSPRPTHPGGVSRVRRRALLGAAAMTLLVTVAGLFAFLTRDNRAAPKGAAVVPSSASSVTAAASPASPSDGRSGVRPALPPSTHDPIAFGEAAAVALWSYDTRAYSQPELLAALHQWLTGETEYADAASIDALVPSPVLWGQMATSGQYATATASEAHFPASFTRALQADPGVIAQTYVYAVTVSGKQSISWRGSPGGAEDRSTTLAVQCRPSRPCALVGVLPTVAP